MLKWSLDIFIPITSTKVSSVQKKSSLMGYGVRLYLASTDDAQFIATLFIRLDCI